MTLLAALVVWVAGGVIVFLSWRRRSRPGGYPGMARGLTPMSPVAAARQVEVAVAVVVAALSLGAAAIHVAAAGEHVEELGDLGLGFYFAAEFQAAWGLTWLVRRGRGMAWVGVAGNGVLVAAWLGSRLVGLPAGPTPWRPEAVGLPDAVCVLFQVAIVALLVAHVANIGPGVARRLRDAAGAAMVAAVPTIGLVVVAASISVSVAVAGHEHVGGAGREHGAAAGAAETGHADP